MTDAVFIVGPTAAGKTEYAIDYALSHNGEIVSADSMQIYKYLDIGSAKPSSEELALVTHYLIGEIDPKDSFSVYDYRILAMQYIRDIASRGKLPVICGGTGLYINSLLFNMDFNAPQGSQEYRDRIFLEEEGDTKRLHERLKKLDEEAALSIHPNNVKRVLRAIERLEKGEEKLADFCGIEQKNPEINAVLYNLCPDREKLYEKINKRVDIMYERGLVSEVIKLMEMGFTEADIAMKGIGYKEIIRFIRAGQDPVLAKDLIKQNTRHYAKRQMTWFRRYQDAITVQNF